MLYALYQTAADLMLPVRALGDGGRADPGWGGSARPDSWRAAGALCEMMSRATLSHRRPAFGIAEIKLRQPASCRCARRRSSPRPSAPCCASPRKACRRSRKVLLVAPLSGHFATLLRDTVRVLLPEHDVHITDWANARDVGVWHGRFGFDEYVEHLIVVPARRWGRART